VVRKGAPDIQLGGAMFVLMNCMWILRTSNSVFVSVYKFGYIKGSVSVEKDVQEAVVIGSSSEHVHSTFFPTWPII
jgi:hypothetical protein